MEIINFQSCYIPNLFISLGILELHFRITTALQGSLYEQTGTFQVHQDSFLATMGFQVTSPLTIVVLPHPH